LLANTGPASATAQSSIEDTETVATDDGEIQCINTKTARRVSWDGFEKPVKYTQIFVGVELYQNGNQFATKWIHDTDIFSLTGTWSAPGEETSLGDDHEAKQSGYVASDADCDLIQASGYSSGSSFPDDPMPANRLYAGQDGKTGKTKVVLKSQYRLYDTNQNELTGASGYPDRPKASSSFVVTVNSQETTTRFGSGDSERDTSYNATVNG